VVQRFVIVLAVVIMWSMSVPALAAEDQKTYSVVSYHIPLLVDDAGNGAFVVFLKEAAARAGIEYKLELYPTKRAMQMFEDGKAMAIIPALLPTLAKDSALTTQIFAKNIHGFVRSGDAVPESVDELKGKRIGLVRGFSYPRTILYNEDIVVDYADTTGSSLKKLLEGRVDVVIVDGKTAIHSMRQLGLVGVEYDLSAILHSQPAFIAFQPTQEGKDLASRLSAAIVSMREDGTYDAIMPKLD